MINMEYNSVRPPLMVPEYGRIVQNMVNKAKEEPDRDIRNRMIFTVSEIIAQLNPILRESQEGKQKIWDYIFRIADYDLDVDSPFPIPSKEEKKQRPTERLSYPKGNIKYRHYGRTTEQWIEFARGLENKEEKDAMTGIIANLMKKAYLNHNRDSVDDVLITNHLSELSCGELIVREDFELSATSSLLIPNKPPQQRNNNKRKSRKGSNKKRRF